ncbi:hypothetical protein [Paenibacillus polymyxa]|nr:hypothetical protein [Paenibacillus polymyxa]MBY7740252.1 hypothetical protein [Paenibacillus polymyxa]MEE4581029.1 hypothetical protein [Paenibacillus polymyxa]
MSTVTAMHAHALMQNWMVNLFDDAFFCVGAFFVFSNNEMSPVDSGPYEK